ncbi:aminoacyl tRNA synthase complex-interacting multifunctional protein 2-like [Actinia tenebrosa]|uniref:Aminoacyl tRNA synthase complex-interacting multifunctional protein 2-like n=1 Tax=Actinia tenebrosa TaxID=6105 RepID=A0A6P8HPA5_ACTTE|nr:aminoacyl tRNA synthase complex-interacting multifunctional protein 2-like [Actinia tenebrosa]
MLCAPRDFKMAAVQSVNPPMYKLPVLYNNSSPLDLPTCMYQMSSCHYEEVSDGNDQREDILTLENKQENILRELEVLRTEINGLASKLEVKLPTKRSPVSVDYVISASPQDPPLSLFLLQRIMNQRNMVHCASTFLHSSVSVCDVTKVPTFQKPRNDRGRQSPCLLTVVWKNVPDLPYLVISSSHTPLFGEFTIARHLSRACLPDLYSKFGIDEIAHIDHWIHFASNSILNSKSKERADALHTLNSYLKSKTWLVGNQMSLADIAVASACLQVGSLQPTFGNVKKWLDNFPSLQ